MSRKRTSPRTTPKHAWTAFCEVENWRDIFTGSGATANRSGGTLATGHRIDQHFRSGRYFANDLYAVVVVDMPMPAGPDAIHLLIMPRDNRPGGSWSDLQRIKNEVVGANVEMYQLHPTQAETVDVEHTYHLWGYRDAAWRLPLGLDRSLHLCARHDFHTSDGIPVHGMMYIPTKASDATGT